MNEIKTLFVVMAAVAGMFAAFAFIMWLTLKVAVFFFPAFPAPEML